MVLDEIMEKEEWVPLNDPVSIIEAKRNRERIFLKAIF